MRSDTQALLLEITHCPIVERCKDGATDDPCFKVVSVQGDVPLEDFQVPEPWDGDLEAARLLFVSSNPSIAEDEAYPAWSSGEGERIDFFRYRFGGGAVEWVGNRRTLLKDGNYSERSVSYWNHIHARAVEFLGEGAVMGSDYALTEVVRCKSTKNRGVWQARMQCALRYLPRTIECAAAPVIVVIGEEARAVFVDLFGGPERRSVYGPVEVGKLDRTFVSLGAPNSSDPQKVSNCLSAADIARLQLLLK